MPNRFQCEHAKSVSNRFVIGLACPCEHPHCCVLSMTKTYVHLRQGMSSWQYLSSNVDEQTWCDALPPIHTSQPLSLCKYSPSKPLPCSHRHTLTPTHTRTSRAPSPLSSDASVKHSLRVSSSVHMPLSLWRPTSRGRRLSTSLMLKGTSSPMRYARMGPAWAGVAGCIWYF